MEGLSDLAMVVFTPSGLRARFVVGSSVLQAAQSLGVDLESACGGRGLCGRCQVIPGRGHYAKHNIHALEEHLSPITEFELKRKKIMRVKDGRRLGCRALIQGDMVIDVPEDSQIHQQHISKDVVEIEIDVDPAIKLYTVSVAPPELNKSSSDFLRLCHALRREHTVDVKECDPGLLPGLQKTLREGEWTVTVAVYNDTLVVALWPGFKETVYGLAVDLGSTTIAAHLCELRHGQVVSSATCMNPQIRFGEDLMSRVSYVMMNPGGDLEMTHAVRLAFNELVQSACSKADISNQDILEMVVVGNPVMHHLFLGIDPTPLGSAPFALATEGLLVQKASELAITLHPQAKVCVLPCIAGHIGADTAAVILAEKPWLSGQNVLLVDIGTNAEIVLGNQDRLLAASSPTGPAFEGAQISCGQRAARGAIERVRIDPESLESRFKVIGCELWSNEPGFDDAVKSLTISGICGSGIIEVIAEMFLCGIISQDGVINPAMADKSPRIIADGRTFSYIVHEGDVTLKITQNDVRAIQLAKAALYAGIKLLMDRLEIQRPDKISIAGAFGSHIDVKYAMVLGLIPDCELAAVAAVGNAAGTGARIALLDHRTRREIERVLLKVEKIETAIEPAFQEHFIQAMALPHKIDSFDQLAQVISLPELINTTTNNTAGSRGIRSRRKRRKS